MAGRKIIALTGITGSGKTALSIKIAKEFNGEIISCDSRQVYKYLDIGTAKITPDEMQGVQHHLLDVVDPTENRRYSLADFVCAATAAIDSVLSRGKIPILVGGTGLYSRAILEGYNFTEAPIKDAKNSRHGVKRPHINMPQYTVLQFCLMPPKEHITPIILARNETRIKNGMFEETKNLLRLGVTREFLLNLGLEYKLNVLYLDGKITIEEYKSQLFNKTMQFIKRQRTWYKRENSNYTHYLCEPKKYEKQIILLVRNFLMLYHEI